MQFSSETAPAPPPPPRKASIFIVRKGELFVFCFSMFWLVLYSLAGSQSALSALVKLSAASSGDETKTLVTLVLLGGMGVVSMAAIG